MMNKRKTEKMSMVELKREGYVEQGYTGEAYAFFDSPRPVNDEDMRPEESNMIIRFGRGEENVLKAVKASRSLRDIVTAGRSNIIYSASDPTTKQERFAESEEAREIPFGYGIHARYGQSNKEAADQLAGVMNYVNGRFVPGKEPFRAAVIYQDSRGEYVFRE